MIEIGVEHVRRPLFEDAQLVEPFQQRLDAGLRNALRSRDFLHRVTAVKATEDSKEVTRSRLVRQRDRGGVPDSRTSAQRCPGHAR